MHDAFFRIAHEVRAGMVALYGSFLAGKCIEASEKIAQRLCDELDVDVVTVEGWCRFDDAAAGCPRKGGAGKSDFARGKAGASNVTQSCRVYNSSLAPCRRGLETSVVCV